MTPQLQQILHNKENCVCATGHRPKDLPVDIKPLSWRIHDAIIEHIKKHRVNYFVSGGALGIDLIFARIVLKLREEKYPGLYLIMVIPCKDQDKLWTEEDKKIYKEVLSKADAVIYVSQDEYKPYLMIKRNDFMLNISKYVIAAYNGQSKGGTANCVNSAIKKNKIITNVW